MSASRMRIVLFSESCRKFDVSAYQNSDHVGCTLLSSSSSCPALSRNSNMSSFPSTTAHANDVYRFGPGSGFRTSMRWIRRLTRKRLFSVQSQYYRRQSVWETTSDGLSEACAGVFLGHGGVGMGGELRIDKNSALSIASKSDSIPNPIPN